MGGCWAALQRMIDATLTAWQKESRRSTRFVLQLDEAWSTKDDGQEIMDAELDEVTGSVPVRYRMEDEEDIVGNLRNSHGICIQFPV